MLGMPKQFRVNIDKMQASLCLHWTKDCATLNLPIVHIWTTLTHRGAQEDDRLSE